MSTLAIVLIVSAACVCCALCVYGIATAVRRRRERRDTVPHASTSRDTRGSSVVSDGGRHGRPQMR